VQGLVEKESPETTPVFRLVAYDLGPVLGGMDEDQEDEETDHTQVFEVGPGEKGQGKPHNQTMEDIPPQALQPPPIHKGELERKIGKEMCQY
jgi:hypothetical protein